MITETDGLQKLRKDVENGVDLGVPDGILINGLGPYRYDAAIVPDGIPYQLINVEPGEFWILDLFTIWITQSDFIWFLRFPKL